MVEFDYNNVVIFGIELVKMLGMFSGFAAAYLAYRANENAKIAAGSSQHNSKVLANTAADVDHIKAQTNGIHHEMIEATKAVGQARAETEHLRGTLEERARGDDKAAAVAKTALAAVAVAAASTPPANHNDPKSEP